MAEGREGNAERPTCSECGSSQLFRDGFQLICTNCGKVVRENIKNLDPEWRSFTQEEKEKRSRAGPPITPTRHDKGLSTDISKKNRDAKGESLSPEQRSKYGRMRRMDWRGKFDKDWSRMLMYALNRISSVCSQLGFPDKVEEEASTLYRHAANADIVRGRSSDAAAAAVVYIACRRNGIPAVPKEIYEHMGVPRGDFRNLQRLVVQDLRIDMPPISTAKYVPKIIDRIEQDANIELEQAVSPIARSIACEVGGKKVIEGRSKKNVAAGAIYLALDEMDSLLSLDNVADSLEISLSSLRGIVSIIEDEVGSKKISQIVKDVTGGENNGKNEANSSRETG